MNCVNCTVPKKIKPAKRFVSAKNKQLGFKIKPESQNAEKKDPLIFLVPLHQHFRPELGSNLRTHTQTDCPVFEAMERFP